MKIGKKILISLIVAVSIIYAFGDAGLDSDLYDQLKFGETMLDIGTLARQNTYSYTSFGFRWFNHEWQAELFMAAVFQGGGTAGLICSHLLAGVLLGLIIAGIATEFGDDRTVGLGIIIALWRAAPLIAQFFAIRPQILSYLFTGIIFYIFRWDERSGPAITIPAYLLQLPAFASIYLVALPGSEGKFSECRMSHLIAETIDRGKTGVR